MFSDSLLDIIVDDLKILSRSFELYNLLQTSSLDDLTDEENKRWRQQLAEHFKSFMEQKSSYLQIRLLAEGRERVRVDRQKDGIHIIKDESLQQKGHRKYFQGCIKQAHSSVCFSRISLNREHGKITYPLQIMLRVGIPIYSPDGINSVLMINVDFEKIASSLFYSSKNSHYFLTDEMGNYIIHPDKHKKMAFEFNKQAKVSIDFPTLTLTKKNRMIGEYKVKTENGNTGVALNYLFLKNWSETNIYFILGSMVSFELIEQESQRLLKTLMLLLIPLILLLSILTIFTIHRLTQPISSLTRAAELVSIGKQHPQIQISGHDEIAVLGKTFKKMLEMLEVSRKSLTLANESLESQVQS